ncbi:sulfatase [Phyllobacterium phragmitis]|uniref:sulfatase n=1 Tax=Phyllobacterium phragmitis TaxID=2670329 RepID=UPI0038B25B19
MKQPNILFIVADDLNSWIEPLGRHPQVKTPNIKRLAAMGTTFTRAYCTAPYCNASRMSVFTGCLPSTTGVYGNEPFWEQPLRRPTFLEHLRRSGYYCFGAGKVFHGTFDYASAGRERSRSAHWRDTENRLELWDDFRSNDPEPMPPARPLNGMFDFDRFNEVSPWNHLFDWGILPADREAEMPDQKTANAVSDFLRAPHDKPFFCAMGLYKPHLPWYVPKRFFDLYPLESTVLPMVKDDDLDDVPDLARKWALNPPDHETVLKHGQWRHAVQGYLASISYCDSLIGQVLDALEASPHADNTIIVLWGDNGFHLGEKLHWRKFVLWEEACRVPFLAAAPGIKTISRADAPVSLVDLFPTLCDLASVPPLDDVDGLSLLPLMRGEISERPTAPEMIWGKDNHSIRANQWRYTRYVDGSEELYDHTSDPYEWTNLAGDPRFSTVLSSLRTRLQKSQNYGSKQTQQEGSSRLVTDWLARVMWNLRKSSSN